MKEGMMSGACCMHWKYEKWIQYFDWNIWKAETTRKI